MGGRVVDMADRPVARRPACPTHILPAPAGEAGVERLGGEDVAPNQQVGGEDILLGRLPAGLGRQTVAARGQRPVHGVGAGARRLGQREAAEGHGRVVGVDQHEPAVEEVRRDRGRRLASRNSRRRAVTASSGGEAIATGRAALVLGQVDEAGGRRHGPDRRADGAGQVGIARAIVEHHDLDRQVWPLQRRDQRGGIVAIGRDQHREARLRAGPGWAVDGVDARAHAGLAFRKPSAARPWERRPATSSA